MARARGANAVLAFAYESIYGTPPGSGFFKLPFVSSSMGEQQKLIASNLLGFGREPQEPAQDIVTNDGDVVVPLDLRNIGYWLKLLFGSDTVTAGVAATGSFAFSAQPTAGATITIGGAPWTFVSASPTGDESLIGADLATTLANAVQGLNASATPALAAQTYALNLDGNTIEITSTTIGIGGNSVTLAAGVTPASNATASGADMAGGAASGAYNHVWHSGGLTLPSASLEIGMPEVPSYGMNYGVMADKLAITLQKSGLLNATVTLIGQGESVAGSSAAGTPTELDIARFTQFSGQILQDGVPLANVVSGSLAYANNLDKIDTIRQDGRIAGSDPADVTLTGDIKVRFADTTLLDLATSNTPTQLSFGWQIGPNQLLNFRIERVFLPKPNKPITGPKGIEMTFPWQAAMHPILGRSATITLVNDVASY